MAKQDKNERQAKIDAIRKQQKSADRRGNLVIVGVASILGIAIIGAAAWKPITDSFEKRDYQAKELSTIGAKASVCGDVITKPGAGVMDHVQPGTPIDYEESPPAFGQHYDSWDTNFDRKFYTDDRLEVGYLVHNLEHGYTILWYDETAAADKEMMSTIKGLAAKFDGDNLRNKFKAVPWTAEDGEPFPDGKHIALTHWSKGGATVQTADYQGVWQYCSEPSGAALEKFMQDYPYMDSPEPEAG